MSDKRIQVPPAMLDVGTRAISAAVSKSHNADPWQNFRIGLEAALRWLSENPIVPTEKQYREFGVDFDYRGVSCIKHWVSAMFLAPEPEVPEAIKDLLERTDSEDFDPQTYNAAIIEAYNRGLKESK